MSVHSVGSFDRSVKYHNNKAQSSTVKAFKVDQLFAAISLTKLNQCLAIVTLCGLDRVSFPLYSFMCKASSHIVIVVDHIRFTIAIEHLIEIINMNCLLPFSDKYALFQPCTTHTASVKNCVQFSAINRYYSVEVLLRCEMCRILIHKTSIVD